MRWQSEERGIGFSGGRRCEELFVVYILSYQQKPANPILTTRMGCTVINCSIAAGSVMKPTGLNVDAQRPVFVHAPVLDL
jgi:hypothetical protein